MERPSTERPEGIKTDLQYIEFERAYLLDLLDLTIPFNIY